jgi:hypothetical protein
MIKMGMMDFIISLSYTRSREPSIQKPQKPMFFQDLFDFCPLSNPPWRQKKSVEKSTAVAVLLFFLKVI